MSTWIEDVIKGLDDLNGSASLSDIYKKLREIRQLPHPKSFDAIIRREIESHSSDSEAYTRKGDYFYSVEGLGGGVWGLRNYLKNTPIAIDADIPLGFDEPARIHQETYRILRDTNLARKLKLLHQNKCQLCGTQIELQNGKYYSEAHHITPLGNPHDGPDIAKNIIVLCPNHHVMLDYGAIKLDQSLITAHPKHTIDTQNITYHNDRIWGKVDNQ